MLNIEANNLGKYRRDAWIEINLNNLEYNIQALYNKIKKPLIPVLKADAYGHGAKELSKILDEFDFVDRYAVASLDEALDLKTSCKKSVMILGLTPAWAMQIAIDNAIELTITDLDSARKLNELASKASVKQKIHIKVDTGMNRIGFNASAQEFQTMVSEISAMQNLEIESIFSHFSDPKDKDFSYKQAKLFQDYTANLNCKKHIASSAAAVRYPDLDCNYVRCGIELYGLENPDLKPLLSLYSRISHIKQVAAGEYVSYKRTWQAQQNTCIATLPLGYADGLVRNLSNKIQAYLNQEQKFIKQVGTITMDQLMFDLAEQQTNIQVGDIVELLGEHITVQDWAQALNTISYEIVCNLNLRLPKTYTR